MCKKMWPYLLICGLIFYIPITAARLTQFGSTGLLMVLLLAVMPLTCLFASILFALRQQFHLLFSVALTILFIPIVLIFMDGLHNTSGWIYVPAYFVISIAGMVLGNLAHWRKT